jgi:deoxyribonuclease-4
MSYIGRHLSVAKIGINGVIKKSIDNGLLTTQIFIGPPQATTLSKINDKDKKEIKELISENNFILNIHGKYLYNLSKTFEPDGWTIKTLEKELLLGDSIGGSNLIIHMGKMVKLNKETAGTNFITSVKHITKFIKDNNLNINLSLEVATGQGTEMFYQVEEFCQMFNSFTDEEKKHLSVTIDTCHAFSAGHNLNTETDKYIKCIKRLIGLQYIQVIHLNGSKVECGAKKDRHSNLNEGFIKYEILKKWAKFGLDNNIMVICETPNTDENGIKECLKLIEDVK